jgi:hypothetical protein
MFQPNWACAVCGMCSGRKESVMRHINNPNIHMGNGTVIPFSDSLIARLTGACLPHPSDVRWMYNRQKDRFSPKSENLVTLLEKTCAQKLADKIADSIVNSASAGLNQPTNYNYNIPNVINNYNDLFTNTEDVYAIHMQVCPKCLMIEPVKLRYAKGENIGCIRNRLILSCSPPQGYILESQRGQYLRGIAEDGIRPHLKNWIDCFIPSPKDRRIAAIPVPQLSPNNSMRVVRLSVNQSGSDSTIKKYGTVQYLKENCCDLLMTRHNEPTGWSTRVLQNGKTTLVNDEEVLDFLSHTNNSTYGFFAIQPKDHTDRSTRIPSGSIYLIMLLFGNNPIPVVENVFDNL